MRVLVACEFSGAVRDAFRERGHEAWSCDLDNVRPEGRFLDYHLIGDCRYYIDRHMRPVDKWDLIIAHPPCTFLANSGVQWLHKDRGRWRRMEEAVAFFRELCDAPALRVAVENPIPHKYAKAGMGAPAQVIQPWQFGHRETKATCLWLRGLPPLEPTRIMANPIIRSEREAKEWRRMHRLGQHVAGGRAKARSRTYSGIAAAMAEQWGQQ